MRAAASYDLAVFAATLAVWAELSVSANLLTWLGIPYVADGGDLPVKLHPGTHLLFLATTLTCLRGAGWRMLTANGELLGFVAGMGACAIYLLVMTGSGHLVVLLDTFLPAGLLAMMLGQADRVQLETLRRGMQLLFMAGAALALVETALHTTLIPLYLNDAAYYPHVEDFRPIALYDHPLTGAVMMMLGLSLLPVGGFGRLAYGALLSTALLSFGGRMSVAVMLLIAGASWALPTARLILSRNPRAFGKLMTAMTVMLVILPIAAAAFAAGLGTRIAGHLYWDDSAQVRLAQWQLLGQLDSWQLMFGTQRQDLLALMTPLWLGFGVEVIENFWLLMFVAFGAVGFPLFVGSLFSLLAWCWRRSRLRGRLMIVGVMLVASTSNSLGRKSTILVCLVATIACAAIEPHRARLPHSATVLPRARIGPCAAVA